MCTMFALTKLTCLLTPDTVSMVIVSALVSVLTVLSIDRHSALERHTDVHLDA